MVYLLQVVCGVSRWEGRWCLAALRRAALPRLCGPSFRGLRCNEEDDVHESDYISAPSSLLNTGASPTASRHSHCTYTTRHTTPNLFTNPYGSLLWYVTRLIYYSHTF